jgi:hypothetical protein
MDGTFGRFGFYLPSYVLPRRDVGFTPSIVLNLESRGSTAPLAKHHSPASEACVRGTASTAIRRPVRRRTDLDLGIYRASGVAAPRRRCRHSLPRAFGHGDIYPIHWLASRARVMHVRFSMNPDGDAGIRQLRAVTGRVIGEWWGHRSSCPPSIGMFSLLPNKNPV